MENTIVTEPGDIGRPIRACRRHKIVQCKLEKFPNHGGKWIASGGVQAEIPEAALQEPSITQ